jgi:hypothetical protein
MAKWQPHPSVRPLLDAMTRAQQRRDTTNRNVRLGRDPVTGRAPLFPSTLPGSRGFVSPLQGQAKPAEQSKRRP